MAHWAELDNENRVIRVLVTDNNDSNGDEGYKWLMDNLGGNWIKTSYNGNIRKNFAGIGFYYDANLDAFIPPKQFDSWILDTTTANWVPPKLKPSEGEYYWNEEILDWVRVDELEIK